VNVKVNHYLMDIRWTYPATPNEVEELEKTTWTRFTWEVKQLEWFTLPEAKSVIVSADGSSEIDYYYERNKYSITLNQTTWFVYELLSWSNERIGEEELTWKIDSITWTYYYEEDITINGEVEDWYAWQWWEWLWEAARHSWTAWISFKMPSSNVNAIPVLSANEYKVTFKDGETIISQMKVKYGEIIPLPQAPTKEWYAFRGWKNLPEDGKMLAENLELQAQWERNPSSWWWGWWGGWSHSAAPEEEHGSAPTTWEVEEENTNDPIDMTELEEMLTAYEWAYKYGITTLAPISAADEDWVVTRWHMAKMLVNYMVWILGYEMPTQIPSHCQWWDAGWARESAEIKDYAEKSCALWVMWIEMKDFLPNDIVNRAQFGTTLSRILWWEKYNVKDSYNRPYYEEHLKALNESWIMKDTSDPERRTETRKWLWMMLRRSADKAKQIKQERLIK